MVLRFLLVVSLWLMCGPAQAADPLRLVVLGDSLTAGYQLPPDAAFPVVLERALRAKGWKVNVENAGVSGDTASGGLDRLDWSVGEGAQAVIVELGANDMLRGIDPAVTSKALDTIVARLKSRGVAVMLAGMLAAPNLGPDYGTRFNGLYPALARKHGVPLYPFFMDGVTGNAQLIQKDGLHPTREGVEAMVMRILPAVESFLNGLAVKG